MYIAKFTELQEIARTAKTGDILCHEIVSTMGLDEYWDNTVLDGSKIFDLALDYCDATNDKVRAKLLKALLKELHVERTLPLR